MSSLSDEFDISHREKKIRFRPTKVLFSDNKVEDVYRNNKSDSQPESGDYSKKG